MALQNLELTIPSSSPVPRFSEHLTFQCHKPFVIFLCLTSKYPSDALSFSNTSSCYIQFLSFRWHHCVYLVYWIVTLSYPFVFCSFIGVEHLASSLTYIHIPTIINICNGVAEHSCRGLFASELEHYHTTSPQSLILCNGFDHMIPSSFILRNHPVTRHVWRERNTWAKAQT